MVHRFQTPILSESQTTGIVQLLAIIEFSALLHIGKNGWPADASLVEILIPFCQVFYRREKAGRADIRVLKRAILESATVPRFIRVRTRRDNPAVIVVKVG